MKSQKVMLREFNYAKMVALEDENADLRAQLVIHEEEGTKASFERSAKK